MKAIQKTQRQPIVGAEKPLTMGARRGPQTVVWVKAFRIGRRGGKVSGVE